MKTTVVAPANIALIKYWGKRSEKLRIPLNDSISMNISGATTRTTVDFLPKLSEDIISFVDEDISSGEEQRIVDQLDRIRKKARKHIYAKVVTKNSFPKGTGIASSASGFAALTVAATHAIGLSLSERELTVFARLGSGSACRSIPDGFSLWHAGKTSFDSYAESLFPSTWWNIRDILCIVSKETKKISSTAGMEGIRTSPLWKDRIDEIPEKIIRMTEAIKAKNFDQMGSLMEDDMISMHCVMMTQKPPLFYWNEATLQVMNAVYALRANGIPAYGTIDAGPNVHVICRSIHEDEVSTCLSHVEDVQSIVRNSPTEGAHCINDHLF